MRAGASGSFSSARRGASTGQGATIRKQDLAPLPSLRAMESLEEISGWLGTFRERLRLARHDERAGVAVMVEELEARFRLRRAELS